MISEVFERYPGLRDKTVAMVSDTTAVMPATARELNLRSFGCIPHIINFVVNDGIRSACCANLFNSVSDIIAYIRKSGKANNRLKKIQQQLNLPQHKVMAIFKTSCLIGLCVGFILFVNWGGLVCMSGWFDLLLLVLIHKNVNYLFIYP